MSKYFKFQSDSDLGVGIQYIEFNDSGWAIRQVECYEDRWFNSNKTYHQELGSMSLCDQQLTMAGMELGESIDAEEFELAWNLSNKGLVQSQFNDVLFMFPDRQSLTMMIVKVLQTEINISVYRLIDIAHRIAVEVDRICAKSDRIQNSGIIESWRIGLARHRISKCLYYYQLGSRQGRIELHSHLSSIVYRYITIPHSQLGFQARYSLIEDFLQEFYTESLKAFRRENQVGDTYTPRSSIQLAEYMVFTECYGKRRIHLRYGSSQQLIVLRAQTFVKRQSSDILVHTGQDFEINIEDIDTEVNPCEYVLC
jgi:hypothetical protein